MTSYYKKSKNIDILFQNLCFFIKCHEALLKMCWELKVEKFVWVENIVLVDLWCRHTKGTKKVGFDFSLELRIKFQGWYDGLLGWVFQVFNHVF